MLSKLYISVMRPRLEVRNHVRRHRRQLHDMTQQELADRVGVTRQTILSIERGRYDPSVGLALRLAETFGVPVETLFEIDREHGHD
jgi:putative transcriptional regulator